MVPPMEVIEQVEKTGYKYLGILKMDEMTKKELTGKIRWSTCAD